MAQLALQVGGEVSAEIRKTMKSYLSLIIGIISVGCKTPNMSNPTNGMKAFYLTEERIHSYEKQSDEGNSDAALQLFRYYAFYKVDKKLANKWLRTSRDLGNLPAMKYGFME